ncbi:MAG TPA: hypothetical protein VGE23_01275 [Candidatus Paceibacterota bacterium]
MTYFLRVLAAVYLASAVWIALVGLTGFAFSASQDLVRAASMLALFLMIAGVLVLCAREAWKGTGSRSLLRYLGILLPGVILGGYFVLI